MNIRIGFGYDAHRFSPGIPFVLGGINIPSDHGCIAHSDGDVLIHAVIDALLGAAGLRDIGTYFPDTSGEFKNIDSKILLHRAMGIIAKEGYSVVNIDTTVLLEAPKIKDYIIPMKEILSGVIGIPPENIGIKAGTNEKMGFVGKGEGVAAYAVTILTRA